MDVDHQQQLRLQRQRGPHIGPGEPEVDPGAAPSRIQPHNRIQSCACSVDVGPPPGAMPSNASLYDPQSQNVQVVKCVVVGDSAVGKTRLICTRAMGTNYSLHQLSTSRVPSVWAIDHYRKSNRAREMSWTTVDDVNTMLQLWDTFGCHEKDRRFAYGSADVVMICFSVVRPYSLRSVLTHWMPEVIRLCGPNVPVVLVATQIDLRYLHNDPEFIGIDKGPFFKEIRESHILTPEDGQQMAAQIGAAHYYETSVLEQFGISCTFRNAVRAALISRSHRTIWNVLTTAAAGGPLRRVRAPLPQRPFLPPRPRPPPIEVRRPARPWTEGVWLAAAAGEHCDVTFEFSDGGKVTGHRAMLICTCPRFRRLFVGLESLPLFRLRTNDAVCKPLTGGDGPRVGAGGVCSLLDKRTFNSNTTAVVRKARRYDETMTDSLGTGHGHRFNVTVEPEAGLYPLESAAGGSTGSLNDSSSSSSSDEDGIVTPSTVAPSTVSTSTAYVYVDAAISSPAFVAFLRYLYTDEYTRDEGDLDEEVKLLSDSVCLYECPTSAASHEPNVRRARTAFRLHNINKLLLDQNLFADITFELEDGKIFAHKFMMAANCHMIKRMFTPFQFLESSIKSIKFPGISYATFRLFKRYLYLNQLNPWNYDNKDTNDDNKDTNDDERFTVIDPVQLISFADELCMPGLLTLTEHVVAEQMLNGSELIKEAILLYDHLVMNNANQLAKWCLWYLSVNYSSLFADNHRHLISMSIEHQVLLRKKRWPPIWYLKAIDVYNKATQESPLQEHTGHRSNGCLGFCNLQAMRKNAGIKHYYNNNNKQDER